LAVKKNGRCSEYLRPPQSRDAKKTHQYPSGKLLFFFTAHKRFVDAMFHLKNVAKFDRGCATPGLFSAPGGLELRDPVD
jgi:hypothetical protein